LKLFRRASEEGTYFLMLLNHVHMMCHIAVPQHNHASEFIPYTTVYLSCISMHILREAAMTLYPDSGQS
jgi:hypothetical protein